MRSWRHVPSERRALYCAIGLRLVDAFTLEPPMGRVEPHLDIQDGGSWQPTEARVLVGPAAVVTSPGLERRGFPAAAGPRRYRLRVDAELYRPLYRMVIDGVEFDAHPYDDFTPPQTFATSATDTLLMPTDGYPFPGYVRVLRGQVVDSATEPVEDAVVMAGPGDRTLSAARGAFALPLRVAVASGGIVITADHPRSGRSGSIPVTLPDDLGRGHTIQVL